MNILSLDGGGSKGVYALGVLREFEQYIGVPLHEHFSLIYGTSTGAIIAALLGLGKSAVEIQELYFELIPRVMRHRWRSSRTRALVHEAERLFGDATFEAFKTRVALVATAADSERPMIFKSSEDAAYRLKSSFTPGFGVTIASAIVASAAAFPFFKRAVVKTTNQGQPQLLDGGFAANNPTLLALADAHKSLGQPLASLKILSVGVGHYQEPAKSWYKSILFRLWPFDMINKMFGISTNTLEGLRAVLFPDVACVRIDESYADAKYATDLLEADTDKLMKLLTLGRDSYRRHEVEIHQLFPIHRPEEG